MGRPYARHQFEFTFGVRMWGGRGRSHPAGELGGLPQDTPISWGWGERLSGDPSCVNGYRDHTRRTSEHRGDKIKVRPTSDAPLGPKWRNRQTRQSQKLLGGNSRAGSIPACGTTDQPVKAYRKKHHDLAESVGFSLLTQANQHRKVAWMRAGWLC